MRRNLQFNGTGGGLLVNLLVGALLTAITFGIYYPWFICNLQKYMAENTVFDGDKGRVTFDFQGTGGGLFVTVLVGALLTAITFGIYYPWFIVKLISYFMDHAVARAADGTEYKLRFDGTGGDLFVTLLAGALLTVITIGIYYPWFICKLHKFMADNTMVLANGNQAGQFSFLGTGGGFFATLLVGVLLTVITLGIYYPWFIIKVAKFVLTNTEAILGESKFSYDFAGTGGQLFVKILVGLLLTVITLGIYYAWFIANLIKFKFQNLQILDKA